MNYNDILNLIPKHVSEYLQANDKGVQLPYHNINHTKYVVEAAKQIAHHYQLNEHHYFVAITAAWFHDIGYYSGEGKEHELRSAAAAEEFLLTREIDSLTIQEVRNCILATTMPQKPANIVEQIVCDADLFNLGTEKFKETNKFVRRELELNLHTEIDKNNWRIETITFMNQHQYHTNYCQLLLNDGKQNNLEALMEKNKTNTAHNGKSKVTELATLKNLKPHENSGKEKEKKPVRGIETMFRVASTNHQRLSDMADSKAHIMISVNAIILSVVIGLVARRLESVEGVLIPTIILLAGSVTAIIFSVLSTRPKIPGGVFTEEQLKTKNANLLFFGNFYKMSFDKYYDGMKRVMDDGEYLYRSLIRDIHTQGTVLGNKYRLLRLSYTIFMYTIVISVIAYSLTFIFFIK